LEEVEAMVKRIVVLQKGIEKREMAGMACCSNAPTTKSSR
jgi:hypothetical protein